VTTLFDDLFIFEMANNHQGSVDHGIKIIDAMGKIARTHGIRAGVKLQYRDLDTFIHPDFKDRDDVKHISRFLSTRLADKEFLTLVDAVRDRGLTTVVTPFDEPSVLRCVDHGVEIIKIASCSATDWPLLEAIAAARKPVICSTGGLSVYDIDNIVSFFSHRKVDLALLHCVAMYPAPNDALCMNFLNKMARRYRGIPIGYSGHESPDNLDVVKVAVSKGASILERHVGVPTDAIALNKYSMAPEQAGRWVAGALVAKAICGAGDERAVSQTEIDSLRSLQRGVYAARDIGKERPIGKRDVFFAMPCADGQTTSGDFGAKRATFAASQDYARGEPIRERRQPDTISTMRSIIHDAKGMIFEAGIVLGNDIEIELSHHHGIEHFRQTGALIVNVINRAYCKKIVVQLPGQKHPNHHHRRKEETFQLLWGDLRINLNGIETRMEPGDKLLIERGAWHSFTTDRGGVFEEISTTHIQGDSYYEDPRVAALDPVQRKTMVDTW
jgi:sialic acid synthase SpsE/mannose-6-phosphate isomerase-like protein (cupin superfamily)